MMKSGMSGIGSRLAFGAIVFVACMSSNITAQEYDSLDRLIHRAGSNTNPAKVRDPNAQSSQVACEAQNATCLVPSTIESSERARRANFESGQPITLSDPSPFANRPITEGSTIADVVPLPVGYGAKPYNAVEARKARIEQRAGAVPKDKAGIRKLNPTASPDEFVFDGSDRGEKARVDQSWNVYGLQTEDTIGHFDTLDGRRIVAPSNRVAIYAPRFGAVRRVDGVFRARLSLPTGAYEENIPVADTSGGSKSTSSKQNLGVERFEGARRASQFVDQTRGVVSDNVTHLFGIRNRFEPFENLSIIRFGKYSKAETARLNLGIMSAGVWQDNLGLQVVTEEASPIVVKDVTGPEELIRIESEDGTAILRVLKVASKIAARTGEFVDFTIRFDNLSRKKIGNVTIIDNLTTRLEYVPESAECSLKADFIADPNEGDSLMLRWEITDPIPAGEGGIVRFRCRVR